MAKVVDLRRGETDIALTTSLIGSDDTVCNSMKNTFLKPSYGVGMRPSNELLGQFDVGPDEVFSNSYESTLRGWLIYGFLRRSPIYTIDGTIIIRVCDSTTGQLLFTLTLPPLGGQVFIGERINFLELRADTDVFRCNYGRPEFPTGNIISGVSSIVVMGNYFTYFFDDRQSWFPFWVFADQQIFIRDLNGVESPDPSNGPQALHLAQCVHACRAQGRIIFIACFPYLGRKIKTWEPDQPNPLVIKGTQQGWVDNYEITDPNDPTRPFEYNMLLEADERIYTVNDLFMRLIVTTNRHVYSVFGTNTESQILEAGQISHNTLSTAECTGNEPILLDSALVYATTGGFRTQEQGIFLQLLEKSIPDRLAPTFLAMYPYRLVQDVKLNIIYHWEKDKDKHFVTKATNWYSTPDGGKILATTTYFSDPEYNCWDVLPKSRTLLLNNPANLTYYLCQEDHELGIGEDKILTITPSCTVSNISVPNRTMTVSGLDVNVAGFWANIANNTWHFFVRSTGTQYLCTNNVLNMASIPSTISQIYVLSADIYQSIVPVLMQEPNQILSTSLDLVPQNGGDSVVYSHIREITNGTPYYMELLDETQVYLGTIVQTIGRRASPPTLTWYGSASFVGSVQTLQNIILVTSASVQGHFDLNVNDQPAYTLDNTDGYEYATFKFKFVTTIGANLVTLQLKPTAVNFDASDCDIKQLMIY